MQKFTHYSLIFCFIYTIIGTAQNVESPYEVAIWKGFSKSAISYTWDDNISEQLTVALPMYDALNLKMTFFLTTSFSANWDAYKEASENGHEIAAHSISHSNFGDMTDETLINELLNPQETINAKLGNNKCISIAYPYCVSGDINLVSNYYVSGRSCQGYVESQTPNDLMQVSSISCGTEGTVKTTEDFNTTVDSAITTNGWCVFLFHAIDGSGWSPVDSSELQPHLEYVAANPNKFWIATYSDTVRYITQRDAIIIQEILNKSDLIQCSITHNLDQTIYNTPISIQRPLPSDWEEATITQNGTEIPSHIIDDNGAKVIRFDVIPNNGDVFINKSGELSLEDNEYITYSSLKVYPNPFKEKVTLEFFLKEKKNVSFSIINQSGKKLYTIEKKFYSGKQKIKVPINGYKNEVLFCIIEVDGHQKLKKLIPTN